MARIHRSSETDASENVWATGLLVHFEVTFTYINTDYQLTLRYLDEPANLGMGDDLKMDEKMDMEQDEQMDE